MYWWILKSSLFDNLNREQKTFFHSSSCNFLIEVYITMFSFVTDKLQEKATNIPNSLKLLIFVSTNELTYWQTEQSLYSCCACAHVVNYHYSSPAWRQLISWQLIYYACPWGWPVCYVHIPIGIDILVICSKLYSEVTCNNAAANCTIMGSLWTCQHDIDFLWPFDYQLIGII